MQARQGLSSMSVRSGIPVNSDACTTFLISSLGSARLKMKPSMSVPSWIQDKVVRETHYTDPLKDEIPRSVLA
jgi:hypothetical protein